MQKRYLVRRVSDHECSVRWYGGVYGNEENEDRTYWAPSNGGYVRDITHKPGTLGQQICDGMGSSGNTLYWSGKGELTNIIRREMRVLLREERKDKKRF